MKKLLILNFLFVKVLFSAEVIDLNELEYQEFKANPSLAVKKIQSLRANKQQTKNINRVNEIKNEELKKTEKGFFSSWFSNDNDTSDNENDTLLKSNVDNFINNSSNNENLQQNSINENEIEVLDTTPFANFNRNNNRKKSTNRINNRPFVRNEDLTNQINLPKKLQKENIEQNVNAIENKNIGKITNPNIFNTPDEITSLEEQENKEVLSKKILPNQKKIQTKIVENKANNVRKSRLKKLDSPLIANNRQINKNKSNGVLYDFDTTINNLNLDIIQNSDIVTNLLVSLDMHTKKANKVIDLNEIEIVLYAIKQKHYSDFESTLYLNQIKSLLKD